MTKADLVENVAKAAQLSKRAPEFAVDSTFETIGQSIKKKNGSRCLDSVPSACADEKPEREGILRPERSFTSRQAGLLRLNRPLLSKKGCKKKFVTPFKGVPGASRNQD